jgi:diaminohydroxyphosphoribosylaminopyrimidine deaminase/5-amino-6-(5-phosphoribosylamino)uracil reductase
MARALGIAERGHPSPEPRIGAVVARGRELVSAAYRSRPTAPHPALSALSRAGRRAAGATLYCTLEPVADRSLLEAVRAAGITRVVWGCREQGARAQRLPGVAVERNVLEQRARALIADHRKFRTRGLPFVTLKAAVTLDGRTAARSGESKWITGEAARTEVHRMRLHSDAVLVGIGTVLADDPELTVRAVRGRSPLRVVLDSRLRTPLTAKLVASAGRVPTLIFHAARVDVRRAAKLRAAGVELAAVRATARAGLDIESALRELARRGVVRLLVEGGAHVHAALLAKGLVDRAAVFVAPRILGDEQGIPLVAGKTARSLQAAWVLENAEFRRFGADVLFQGDIVALSTP